MLTTLFRGKKLLVQPTRKLSRREYRTISDGFVGAIGNTPLIRIKSLSDQTQCNILAKAEFMNPGGSVKDRAALGIIRHAEQHGLLKPGGTVIEGTAGNTGIGLAHICNAKGYKCIIYMPNTQSQEKIDLLKALGAEVILVPAVPFEDPMNYNHQAMRHSQTLDNCLWGNQFDNLANRRVHIETTGPEIWEQTKGNIDGWITSTGTGGSYSGVAQYLKSKNRDIKCFVVDPPGSVLYSYFTRGVLEKTGSSITEGIGQGRVTRNMKDAIVDGILTIDDTKTINMVFDLLHKDGLFVGASSALNVCAAVQLANRLGKGSTVVTLLCDSADRYKSRLFSKKWLQTKGLLDSLPNEVLKTLSE